MKKRGILSLALLVCMLLCAFQVSAVNLYPTHSTEPSVKLPVTKVIVYVYEGINEDNMVDIVTYACAAEDTEVWLYPLRGDLENIQVTPTEECVNKLFTSYVGASGVDYKQTDVIQQACDFLNTKADVQKILMTDVNLDNFIATPAIEYDLPEDLSGMSAEEIFTSDMLLYSIEGMQQKISAYPDIDFRSNTRYNEFNASEFAFNIEHLGYTYCPYDTYNRREGKLTIQAGKADDNILIIAQAEKSELLYISGYMASAKTAEKYAQKDKIKGVSLGYNNVNITKNSAPKNVAISLFTIRDAVGDTATEAFETVVKNAENVKVYYKNTPGGGTAEANTTYNKSQDDKIKNLYAPEEEQTTESSVSFFNNDFSTHENPIWSTVKSILSMILAIVLGLIRLGIIAFLLLFAFYKKFRGNVLNKIFASKHGPKIQAYYERLMNFIKSLFATGKKMKGNASLKGKYAFISHASADLKKLGSIIEPLIVELEGMGVPCWTSEEGIGIGEDYNDILPVAIEKCEMMLLFLSPISINSTEVESEVIAAKRLKKKLIPIQISDFDLFANSKWQHILSQYQVKSLLTTNPEEVKKLAQQIKNYFDE